MTTGTAVEVLNAESISAASDVFARSMSIQEWADMDEDEPGEFVDGKLVDDEDSTILHDLVVSWLIGALAVWTRPRHCPLFASGLKFQVAPTRGRKVDVSVFASGTRFRDSMLTTKPPMLVVEVLSQTPRDVKRDRYEKKREYARFGVQHYWLVEPNARIFEFLTLGSDGRWHEATEVASEGRVEVAGFDGFILDLDDLWREVDTFIIPGGDEIIDEEP